MRGFEELAEELLKGPIKNEEFLNRVDGFGLFLQDVDQQIEFLKSIGFPIESDGKYVRLKTIDIHIREQRFCVVDIETNGSNPKNAQIIELGALMFQGGEVIDKFESLIHCTFVPDYITKITSLSVQDLKDAPNMFEVLKDFRLFLGDAVFVAHNVDFDYSFISEMMNRYFLGPLGNRKLCTIDLAKKTIQAERYGLSFLNTHLDINTDIAHRAYADALTAAKILEIALGNLPVGITHTEELLTFAKGNKKKKKKKQLILN